MKNLILIFAVLLAVCNLALAQSPYATRLPAELQAAQMDSLDDLTWLQGTTPAIRVEPLVRGRPVAVDEQTTVRMIVGPSATGTLYAARTNLAAVTNAYEIQWPTIGTNTGGTAWFYTLLFDRAGLTYWSGSGRLYIEASTSTASNGLEWIEYTIPSVGWANVVGDPGDNAALVQYVADHGGGSADDTVARAGVASNAADIAIMQTGKLDVATAASTYQPLGSYITGATVAEGTPLGVTTNAGVLAFTIPAGGEGGDASGWSGYAATQAVDMAGFSIVGVNTLTSEIENSIVLDEANVEWAGAVAFGLVDGTNVWLGRVNDTESSRIAALAEGSGVDAATATNIAEAVVAAATTNDMTGIDWASLGGEGGGITEATAGGIATNAAQNVIAAGGYVTAAGAGEIATNVVTEAIAPLNDALNLLTAAAITGTTVYVDASAARWWKLTATDEQAVETWEITTTGASANHAVHIPIRCVRGTNSWAWPTGITNAAPSATTDTLYILQRLSGTATNWNLIAP
jgi:hypothetical protein